MAEETIDPKLHTEVTVTMTYAEAVALIACAEVGIEGADDHLSREDFERAEAGLKKLQNVVEPGACPTYKAFDAQGHLVHVTIPEKE